jgi:cytochrome c peroxidase
MKTKLIFLLTVIIIVVLNAVSCTKEDSAIDTPQKVYLDLPATPYNYQNGDDNISTLGRVLFYDSHLSVNNSISCGTCHKQALAFSDNVALSRGFENRLTIRNTLPIQNVAVSSGFTSPSLFWDGREDFLQSMVLKPIVNHVEMGMSDVDAIANKVKALPYYKDLFEKAFNSTDVDIVKIASALSSFTGSILSNNTLFDKVNFGTGTLSGLESQGKQLFFTKYNCNSCHQTQEQNGYQLGGGGGFVNIGLDANYADNGKGALNGNAADNGKFRIPNLRNVALTAPYMHDGRFATLEDVLDHYSHGIANHPNLDERLKGPDGFAAQMNISSQEKQALIAFLNTLTDYTMITDPKFSNPFKFH